MDVDMEGASFWDSARFCEAREVETVRADLQPSVHVGCGPACDVHFATAAIAVSSAWNLDAPHGQQVASGPRDGSAFLGSALPTNCMQPPDAKQPASNAPCQSSSCSSVLPPMPSLSGDATRPASPPPAGTMDDLDYVESAANPQQDASRGQDFRVRRHVHQLAHWKAVLKAHPGDPLAFFWREQVRSLEAHLMGQQVVGSKRVLNSDWSEMEEETTMTTSPGEACKRHRA
mmetsp:Transcript_7989/g.15715  ORF Transcript_7989/g.15715 Transcript_7989/m.15715 type:complete len:231 (-) Transcript_7989:69-761(-)